MRGSTVFERRKQINYIYLPPHVIWFYYYLFFLHNTIPTPAPHQAGIGFNYESAFCYSG